LAVGLLQSCSQTIYTPSAQVIPVIENKGDLQVGIDISSESPAITLSAAGFLADSRVRLNYAPTDKLRLYTESSTSFYAIERRVHSRLGIGYLSKNQTGRFFQIFGLAGLGRINLDGLLTFSSQEESLIGRYSQLAIQPMFGVIKKQSNIAFTSTVKRLQFFELSDIEREGLALYIIEPTISFSTKGKDLSFDFEYGYSINLGLENSNTHFVSAGFSYTFSTATEPKEITEH